MPEKQEINLLTLLANEATGPARKLLLKYGYPDASDHKDLEQKLANLYFGSPDKKIEIEKAMAYIHPHRLWLEKYMKAPKSIKAAAPMPTVQEVKASCEGSEGCKSCPKKDPLIVETYTDEVLSAEGKEPVKESHTKTIIICSTIVAVAIITAVVIHKLRK